MTRPQKLIHAFMAGLPICQTHDTEEGTNPRRKKTPKGTLIETGQTETCLLGLNLSVRFPKNQTVPNVASLEIAFVRDQSE